jgi:hypothetical protein
MMLSLLAGAQEPPPPAPTSPPPAAPAAPQAREPEDRAALKARLERRLADTKQLEIRIDQALARLDKGDSPDAVRDSIDLGHGARPARRPALGAAGAGARPDTGPAGRDRQGRPAEKLDPAEREAVLVFVGQQSPETLERIKTLTRDDPAAADRTLAHLAPHVREVQAEPDAESRELKIAEMRNGWETVSAMRKLTETLRSGAKPEETEKASARLQDLLGTHFDLEVKIRNREISLLKDRVAEIQRELSDRLGERQKFVTERFDQFLRRAKERASQPARDSKPDAGPGQKPEAQKSADSAVH